jgi:hypothetical protein
MPRTEFGGETVDRPAETVDDHRHRLLEDVVHRFQQGTWISHGIDRVSAEPERLLHGLRRVQPEIGDSRRRRGPPFRGW